MILTATIIASCANNSVPPENVMAIARVESGVRPYALNIDDVGVFYPKTRAEAVTLIRKYRRHRMDVGLMQISSKTARGDYGITDPKQLLDVCTNIRLGTDILNRLYLRRTELGDQPDTAIRKALSAYNTGHFQRGFRNGYVGKYRLSKYDKKPPTARITASPAQFGHVQTFAGKAMFMTSKIMKMEEAR